WNPGRGGKDAVAGRVKVMDLAKELGVTSKDLVVALEGMGHKSMRATSPLTGPVANELRVKLGRGRDLPAEAKPKRAPKLKEVWAEAEAPEAPGKKPAEAAKDGVTRGVPSPVARTAKVELEPEPPLESKPAATIFRPTAPPVVPTEVVPPPPMP